MGLEVKENLVKCLKDGAGQCEITVENVVYPQMAMTNGSF
jgi:hypothetical protein